MKNQFIQFNKDELERLKDQLGPNYRVILQNRRTGRSTGIALKTIGRAMLSPGEQIDIRDHAPTRSADLNLKSMIQGIIQTLNLEGFTFNKMNNTITYAVAKIK